MPAKAAAKPPYTYVVEGSKYGEFPLDMLRRDESRAATPEDQALIDLLKSMGEGKEHLPKFVRVTLVTECQQFPPNIERWESFGWRVVESNHPRNYGQVSKPRGWEDPDAVRQKTVKKIAEAVVRLRGYVHMADPTYDAVRYAGDVAAQDPPYREKAIGFCEGVERVLASNKVAGFLTGEDVDALRGALILTRELLIADTEERLKDIVVGERPTQVIHKLDLIRRMFESRP